MRSEKTIMTSRREFLSNALGDRSCNGLDLANPRWLPVMPGMKARTPGVEYIAIALVLSSVT